MVGSVVLVVVSLIFALGLCEGAARILGYTPYAPATPSAAEFRCSGPDPDFGWVNKPGRLLSAELGNVPMNFDANGLLVMSPFKPANPRIDIVGDSITQGYAVADDETFAWLMAEGRPDL